MEKVKKELLFAFSHTTKARPYPVKRPSSSFKTKEGKYFIIMCIIKLQGSLLQECCGGLKSEWVQKQLDKFMMDTSI